MTINSDRTRALVQKTWDDDIVPALTEYIRIPAKSPMYDARWAEQGHIDRAVTLITDWARKRKIEGLSIEVVRLEGRTPVILMEVPGAGGETVLLYGHCDKQPEMVGWAPDGGTGAPRRPALRPWRRRRRLRVLRGADRDRDAPSPGHSPRPLRGADRGVGGER